MMANRKRASGNALVLSVFILLSLTSVGIMSLQRANSNLLLSSNVSALTQADLASQVGENHALKVLSDIFFLNNLIANVTAQRMAGNQIQTIPRVAIGSTNSLANAENTIPTQNCAGACTSPRAQQIAYTVDATFMSEIQGVVGNDVNAPLCHSFWDFTSQGAVPSVTADVDDTFDPTNASTQGVLRTRHRVRALIGVHRCITALKNSASY